MSQTESPTLPAFTSRSVNIPRLAIDAANELDDVEHGVLKESLSAKRLAEILEDSFNGKPTKQVSAKSGTVAVFCNALESLRMGNKTNDFREVVLTALQYAKDLNTQKPQQDTFTLEDTKIFCIALAKAAAGYRESVIDAQSRNRWR